MNYPGNKKTKINKEKKKNTLNSKNPRPTLNPCIHYVNNCYQIRHFEKKDMISTQKKAHYVFQ